MTVNARRLASGFVALAALAALPACGGLTEQDRTMIQNISAKSDAAAAAAARAASSAQAAQAAAQQASAKADSAMALSTQNREILMRMSERSGSTMRK